MSYYVPNPLGLLLLIDVHMRPFIWDYLFSLKTFVKLSSTFFVIERCCIFCMLFSDVCGQQKEVSMFLQLWKLGLLVLLISTATSKGPDCGGTATLVVRDLCSAL